MATQETLLKKLSEKKKQLEKAVREEYPRLQKKIRGYKREIKQIRIQLRNLSAEDEPMADFFPSDIPATTEETTSKKKSKKGENETEDNKPEGNL